MTAVLEAPRRRSELAPACRCEVAQRGPNWLFVRVSGGAVDTTLGERLWRLAEQQFVTRVVVEWDHDEAPPPTLGPQLATLCERLRKRGGVLRLCGLSPDAAKRVLDEAGCSSLHNHASAYDAVVGGRLAEYAPKPR